MNVHDFRWTSTVAGSVAASASACGHTETHYSLGVMFSVRCAVCMGSCEMCVNFLVCYEMCDVFLGEGIYEERELTRLIVLLRK